MHLFQIVKEDLDKYFGNKEVIHFIVFCTVIILSLVMLGNVLLPILTSFVIAYILRDIVKVLNRIFPETLSVTIAFLFSIGAFVLGILLILPRIFDQLNQLAHSIPKLIADLQAHIHVLSEDYPQLVSEKNIDLALDYIRSKAVEVSQEALQWSFATVPDIIVIVTYVFLVPIFVLFLLKDWDELKNSIAELLPENRSFMNKIAIEMNQQIANYIKSKLFEMFVVALICYSIFSLFQFHYAALFSIVVGVTVLIPIIGAMVVTFPLLLAAFIQWGLGTEFIYFSIVYFIVQLLDGYIIAPMLFAGSVNLHPIITMFSVLIFGGLWGFWGVFFSVPIALFIRTLYRVWPENKAQ